MPRHLLQPLPKAFNPSTSSSRSIRHRNDENMWADLDRVQVLGEDDGHRGCVNALSWSDDGRTLLSGSDDKRICIWQPDPSPSSSSLPHPLKLADKISTGHRANIFSAKFLPNTSTPTIVSCAGDRDVRVFEVERLVRDSGSGELVGERGDGVTILKCHKDRTKRIATENSPYLFLTVSEDGTVRQHDLRRPHTCRSQCPEPLFYAPSGVDLYSLSVSTVTPHIFAVAGRTDCAFVCDRRMLPRQTPSWGPHTRSSGQVHCVRRLGLPNEEWDKVSPNNGSRLYGEERHITCVKMSPEHADEVAVAFAKHSTSLFSIYDSPPSTSIKTGSPVIVPSNKETNRVSESPSSEKRQSKSKSPSPVRLTGKRRPLSPFPGPPEPFVAAEGVPSRPSYTPKMDMDDDLNDLDDIAESSSTPALGKRRQSDRESVLPDTSSWINRPRQSSELDQQIGSSSGSNITRNTWPFERSNLTKPLGEGLSLEPEDFVQDANKTEPINTEPSISNEDADNPDGAEVEESSTRNIIGPPTPPRVYTASGFLRDEEEDQTMEARLEQGEVSLSDMEELALDILDRQGLLDEDNDEEEDEDDDDDLDEDEDDALDEFDHDDDMDLDDDNDQDEEEEEEEEEFDGDIEIDDDLMDPDIGILGYGGSNASRLESKAFEKVDMIYPKRSFRGARNVETVKDCNFLGTRADKVCSGSDDGNFFVWDKDSGRLEGIWEGDGSVVNVIEQHPTLPLVAVSGIDNTVKMFAPTHSMRSPSFSRMHLSQNIIERNTRLPRFLPGGAFERSALLQFLTSRGIRVRTELGEDEEDGDGVEGCATQ